MKKLMPGVKIKGRTVRQWASRLGVTPESIHRKAAAGRRAGMGHKEALEWAIEKTEPR